MKKYTATILALIFILSLYPVQAQTRSVFWQRWDVLIDNVDTRSNRFDVTETHDVHFTGSFSFGSRVIALTNLESITNVRVSQNGQLLSPGCSERAGTYCEQMTRDGLSIRYYFHQPLSNESAVFQIEYTVVGALRVYEGGDQIWWTAIPDEHFGFSIGGSTVTLELPPGFGPREGIDRADTYGASGNVTVNGTTVRATAVGTIGGSEKFELRVQYPHDPQARIASWQANFDVQRQFDENIAPLLNLGILAISLFIVVGGPLAVLAFWYQRGRDPQVGPVPEFLSEPPSNLPPAIAGTLIDESADTRDIMSTLIDLAQRGYIVMEEDQTSGVFGIGVNRTFSFKRTDKSFNGDLRAYEKRVLKKVFSGNKMERTLDSLKNSFYSVIPRVQSDLYQELVREGLFKSDPATVRKLWYGIGVFILVLAGGAFFLLMTAFDGEPPIGAMLCLPMALGITGLVTLLLATYMPAKTRHGAEEAAKWGAFREYLQNLEKYGETGDAAKHFAEYLPYAVAFGLERSWVRKFDNLDYVPIPYWYYPRYVGGPYRGGYTAGTPLPGADYSDLARAGEVGFSPNAMADSLAGSLQSMSDGLTEMISSASRVITSKPQQSSSGSWGSGGSGWSGGGFSGGGSSGGGSAGFG